MPTLDLFKARKSHTIKLGANEYRVPEEYTVQEVERLLELDAKREALQQEKQASTQKGKEEQLMRFWEMVFDQLEILFQHYQPDLNAHTLKGLISHNEALEILGFFDKYRPLKATGAVDPKKKRPLRNS